jgi:hypothetical protein
MTADIVNLRQRRKTKARAESDKLAAENRAKFGRNKADKQRNAEVAKLEAKRLDAHKRDEKS